MTRIFSGSLAGALLGAATVGLGATSLGQGTGIDQVWSYSASNEGWIPRAVSIGNRGTQVFGTSEAFWGFRRLLSGHDQDPPTLVWEYPSPEDSEGYFVASAADEPIHVALYQVDHPSQAMVTNPVVAKHTSGNAAPDWTYTFPVDISSNTLTRIDISRDGQRIVAVVYDFSIIKARVAVFDADGNGTPLNTYTVSTFGTLEHIDLSDDGSTLYVASSARVNVLDAASGVQLFQTNPGSAALQSHAISADGTRFAFGNLNTIEVYEKVGSTYALDFEHSLPSDRFCRRLGISADGTIVAAGFYITPALTDLHIVALNVNTQSVVVDDVVEGGGTYGNSVTGISVSENGDRVIVGCWGDELGWAPELLVYQPGQDQPVASYDLPGSIMDLDASPDGKWIAVGRKSVHANVPSGGGSIELFTVGERDFRMLGTPHAGSTVTFELKTPAAPAAALLSAPLLGDVPETFPNVTGRLYLDRTTVQWSNMGPVQNGVATKDYVVPSQIGSTMYFQGFSSFPRVLSQDYVKLTVVP